MNATRPRSTVTFAGLAVLCALLMPMFAVVATPSSADAINCIRGQARSSRAKTKQQSFVYAVTAAREGFHNGSYWDHAQPWGNVGVCWDNDNDGGGPANPPDWYDARGWPVWRGHDRKEGSDCSGLVSKAWGLRPRYWEHGSWSYYPTRNTYRPGAQYNRAFVSQTAYYTGQNATWIARHYTNRKFMDIAATDGHVLFIVAKANNGRTRTVESRGHWQIVGPGVKEAGFYTRFLDPNTYRIRERKNWRG